MSDVFISYSTKDVERVRQLAEALENSGRSVWWDRQIPIGSSFDAIIQKELDAAKAVVVVWTNHALASRWVRSEAERAAKQGKALPVAMEAGLDLPLGISLLQTADLTDWDGEPDHPGFLRLADQLVRQSGEAPRPGTQPRPVRRSVMPGVNSIPRVIAALSAIVFVCALVVLSLMPVSQVAIKLEVETEDFHFVSAEPQELFGLLTTQVLEVAGIHKAIVPRSQTQPGRVIESDDPQGFIVQLKNAGHPKEDAAITLESLPLGRHSIARLSLAPDEVGVNVAIDGPPFRFQVNLQDAVELISGAIASGRQEYGVPKPMYLETAVGQVALNLVPTHAGQVLNPSPISVNAVGLFRIEERIAGAEMRSRRISTVTKGRLQISNSFDAGTILTAETDLRFQVLDGLIESIQLRDEHLSLRFRGHVSSLELCERQACESIMPSYLECLLSSML